MILSWTGYHPRVMYKQFTYLLLHVFLPLRRRKVWHPLPHLFCVPVYSTSVRLNFFGTSVRTWTLPFRSFDSVTVALDSRGHPKCNRSFLGICRGSPGLPRRVVFLTCGTKTWVQWLILVVKFGSVNLWSRGLYLNGILSYREFTRTSYYKTIGLFTLHLESHDEFGTNLRELTL